MEYRQSNDSYKYLVNCDGGGTAWITGYIGNDTKVVVPDHIEEFKITGIDVGCFEERIKVEYIEIPDSVYRISAAAFYNCRALKQVVLPDRLREIGEDAFSCCTSLEELEIPSSVDEIGENAFKDCDDLVLVVEEGSTAEEYARSHGISYRYSGSDEVIYPPNPWDDEDDGYDEDNET